MRLFIYIIGFALMTANSFLFCEGLKSLPLPTGPYLIGITKFDLTDPSRKEIEHPIGRLIPIQVYFPMQRGTNTLREKMFEERTAGNWEPLDVKVYGQSADLSLLNSDMEHPVILLNHGDTVAMTDYAFIAEDLASHGYIVVAIQHQLNTDPVVPAFWNKRSVFGMGRVIDNILFVFEWLKTMQTAVFTDKIDLKKIGLIGHSLGGKSLLLLANRTSDGFKKSRKETLLPHADSAGVKEVIVTLDAGGFPYPSHNQYPIFSLWSEELEEYHKTSGCYDALLKAGHKVTYYKGAKHISFMDHGYIDPQNPLNPDEHYFNGTLEERKDFVDQVRSDIREFLKQQVN